MRLKEKVMKIIRIVTACFLAFSVSAAYGEDYLLHTLMTHTDNARTVDFSNDERYVYSAGYDYRVVKWKLDNSENLVYLKGYTDIINCVRVNLKGDMLASAANDNTIKIWSARANTLIKNLKGHDHYVNSVDFSKDGKTLLSAGSDKTVMIWNLAPSYGIQKIFRGHTDIVRDAVFSPNGNYIASCGEDRTVRIWSVKTKNLL